MRSLKILDAEFLPLRLFGLQYFSLASINQFVSDGNCKINHVLSFILLFPLLSLTSSYYYIYGFKHFEDVKSSHNFLQYELKIITYAGRYLIIVVSMIEAFLWTKRSQQLWMKGWKVNKLFKREFNVIFDYKQFKYVMRRRLLIIFSGLGILELIPQISSSLTHQDALLCASKLIGTIIICLTVFKHCLHVDFVNLHLNMLVRIVGNWKNYSAIELTRKISVLRLCYLEILEMAILTNNMVKLELPITVSIIIMCLVRRAYRLYALITGQLHFGAFMSTIVNNLSEEMAVVYALCFCCDRTEIAMKKLMEAVRKIECANFNLKALKALSFLSDQILMQPIGFYVMDTHKLNIEYLAQIFTGILSYVFTLLQFEKLDD